MGILSFKDSAKPLNFPFIEVLTLAANYNYPGFLSQVCSPPAAPSQDGGLPAITRPKPSNDRPTATTGGSQTAHPTPSPDKY